MIYKNNRFTYYLIYSLFAIVILVNFSKAVAGEIPDSAIVNFSDGDPLLAVDLKNNFDQTKNAVNDNAINIANKQEQIVGVCASGSAISSIATDGTITCESVTAVGSGDGYSLDSADGSIIDALVVQDNGNVGIGVTPTSNNAKLHIQRSTTGEIARFDSPDCGWVRFSNGLSDLGSIGMGSDGCSLLGQLPNSLAIKVPNALHLNVGANVANGITLDSAGNVGVGLTAPTYKLHVDGDVGAISFVNLSDGRLKKDVNTIAHATDKLSQLRGVSFRWKKEVKQAQDTESEQYGFIAQEVKEVIPQVVSQNEKGFAGVSYSSLIPLLVESMKEQQVEIKELKQIVKELSSKLSTRSNL